MPSIASKPNLTKREVVLALCEKNPRVAQHDIVNVVQGALDVIADALADGRNAEFRDFGVFQVVHRASRPGRNPNKPAVSVRIPARTSIRFKVGKQLKKRLAAIKAE